METKDLEQWMAENSDKLEFLRNMMANQICVKDELITRLHDELEYYKKDSASRFENQLLKAVIKVRQSMKKRMSSGTLEQKSAEELLEEYQYVFEDLTDLLEQQNCDEIVSRPGDAFDSAIHQAKVELTDDITLDKTVKESLSAGYMKNGKTLIPERVVVFQYKL